ncbi:MAG: hypothetical protein ACRBBN_12615 [Methyloligellaceae bacterium]
MKNNILPILLIGVGMGYCTAAAADPSGSSSSASINLGGDVANTCFIANPPTKSTDSGATWTTTLGANNSSVNISGFVNPETARMVTGVNTITLKFPKVYCNFAHAIGVMAANSGLVNTAQPQSGSENLFINTIHYSLTARLNNNNGSASILTNGDANLSASQNVNHAHHGSMDVEILIDSANQGDLTRPLLAGTFSDVATVKLGPQP